MTVCRQGHVLHGAFQLCFSLSVIFGNCGIGGPGIFCPDLKKQNVAPRTKKADCKKFLQSDNATHTEHDSSLPLQSAVTWQVRGLAAEPDFPCPVRMKPVT